MRYVLLLLVVWTLCPTASFAQDGATLDLIVRDSADQPVVGLSVTVVDSDPAPRLVTTDNTGHAIFAGLHGSSITLTAATTAAGQPLVLDPTTPRDGLVLGLIPHATRTVLLRLDDGLLFLDPLEVFAGTDESVGAAAPPLAGSTPTSAALPLAAARAPDPVASSDPSAMPMHAIPLLLFWCIGVPLLFLVCLAALVRFTRRGQ